MPHGRPYIGPKAQAHIPQEVMDWIKEEAAKRGVNEAVVTRELIVAACPLSQTPELIDA